MTTLTDIAGPTFNGRGQYMLPDPGTGKAQPYSRATTIAKAPEDQGGLMKWAQRMVVIGLGRRHDLHKLAASVDPENRKDVAAIAKDAEEAGGAAVGRNTGTALHSAIEAVNRGHDPLPLFSTETEAYTATLAAAGLEPVPELVERTVANHDARIAGTFDVALRDIATGELYVADLKTGSIGFPAAFAIQLAIYATADNLVTPDFAGYEPTPDWSTERGVIIHLREGGPCELRWIDLTAGAEGLEVALSVRRWRSAATAKKLLTEVTPSATTAGTNKPTTTGPTGAEGTVDSQPSNPRPPSSGPEPAEEAKRRRLLIDRRNQLCPMGTPARGLQVRWAPPPFDGTEASMWRHAACMWVAHVAAQDDVVAGGVAAALLGLAGVEVQPAHSLNDAFASLSIAEAQQVIGHAKIASE